ncbi:MAG: hypothetical protein ACLFRG_10925 [Desulfococcaceae bacterium]
MRGLRRLILPLALMVAGWIVLPGVASATESEDLESRRKRIRHATNRGILSVYDIPFPTYVALGMWEEIDFILNANRRTTLRHQLPGRFYSRPYAVGNRIWVFENSAQGGGQAHIFDPDSLRRVDSIRPPGTAGRPGGVRTVYRDRILLGGADPDVDAALLWTLETGEIQTLRLSRGHYISSLAAEGDRIFGGACGGVVQAWSGRDGSAEALYATADGGVPEDWAAFNQMPCIGTLTFFNDHLVGVGDGRVFVWELNGGRRVRNFRRALPGGGTRVFEGRLFEFQGRRIMARSLDRPGPTVAADLDAPVEDLIVTREPVLRAPEGPVAVAALRGDRGLAFLKPDRLEPIRKTDLRGNALCAFEGRIFATDDRFLYRHDLRHQASEKYDAFLRTIDLSEVEMTPETFRALIQRARRHPDAIPPSAVGGRYLEARGVDLFHAFRYGKIGERTVRPETGESYREEVYGYTLAYELRNQTETGLHITLMFEWSGAYGAETPTSAVSSHWETLFLPPGQRLKGRFVVGEKEPIQLNIFPVKLEAAEATFVEGFDRALNPGNREIGIVREYLDDPRLTHWFSELEAQHQRLETSSVSWLDRLFR